MATYEHKGRLTYKDEHGDLHRLYPVTKIECIEDFTTGESVLYTPQILTDDQKTQARDNIGVNEEIAETLLSLNLINPISDEDGSLAEDDGTMLVVRNDDIFLPDVTDEDDGGVLKVVDGKWKVDTIDIPEMPEINYPVTSVNGQTGDVTIEFPDAPVKSVNGMTGDVVVDIPEQVQADMSQNDSTQPDYIKNRTHWKENTDAVIEWDGGTDGRESFVISDRTYYKISDNTPTEEEIAASTFELSNGESVAVNSDLFTGLSRGIAAVGDYLYVIDESAYKGDGDLSITYSDGIYACAIDGVYPVRFTCGSTVTYHTLDEGFIPDTIARKNDIPEIAYPVTSVNGQTGNVVIDIPEGFSGSWNDLEDKPFGDIKSNVTLIDGSFETQPGTNPDGTTNDIYGVAFNPPVVLEEGTTYRVVVDGEEYIMTTKTMVQNGLTAIYLGNIGIDGVNEDTGEDICIAYVDATSVGSGEQSSFAMRKQTNSVVLLIEKQIVICKQLDEKFIPDTIARKTDVTWENLPDKPFGEEGTGAMVEWTGNLDTGIATKISDLTPTREQLIGGTVKAYVDANGEPQIFTLLEQDVVMRYSDGITAIVVSVTINDATTIELFYIFQEAVTLDKTYEPGILMVNNSVNGLSKLTLEYGSTTIRKIDEKFIPDTIARVSDIPEAPVTSVNGQTGDVVIDIPDSIPTPLTASVGQTIVVKSVDENGKPTEWEAVDPWVMPSSTEGSNKKFKLTIDDNGSITIAEITEGVN